MVRAEAKTKTKAEEEREAGRFSHRSTIDLGDLDMHECIIEGIPERTKPSGTYAVTGFKVRAHIPWTEGQVDITDYLTDRSHEILQHELLRNWAELNEKRSQGEHHEKS